MDLNQVKKYLSEYDGPQMRIMEVCGSHTAAIARNGIPEMLSDRIQLISGPGCPVCVTPSSYIDRLLQIAGEPDTCVVTFGDLIRVPGSTSKSLSVARSEGARVEMVYSPMDILEMARKEPSTRFVFAAVGFETTTPVYALLVGQIIRNEIRNIRLLTAIKTMPEVIDRLCMQGAPVNAFLAPGHVSVVTGWNVYAPLAKRYRIPFVVSGFRGEEILISLYLLCKNHGKGVVINAYPQVVTREGNVEAQKLIRQYFEKDDAFWRGIGPVHGSGMVLRHTYDELDLGSRELIEDRKANPACMCDKVLTGQRMPTDCPLYGKVCTPMTPQGACMVSTEGSCFSWLTSHRVPKSS